MLKVYHIIKAERIPSFLGASGTVLSGEHLRPVEQPEIIIIVHQPIIIISESKSQSTNR